MKKISCSLLLMLTICSHAQYFESVQSFGDDLNDYAFDVVTDDYNNVYFVGGFSETVDFDPGPGIFELTSPYEFDMYISKQDSDGNMVWTKRFGGDGHYVLYGIAKDDSGFLYVTGYYKDDLLIETLDGPVTLEVEGEAGLVIFKLNVDGDVIWVKGIDGIGVGSPESIDVDALGNVYCTGFFLETLDFDPGLGFANSTVEGEQDIFIFKLDTDGEYLWHKTYGSPNTDFGGGITVDQDNNVGIAGQFGGDIDFNPGELGGELTAIEEGAAFFLKLDSEGNYQWLKSIGGTDRAIGQAIDSDSEGNFLIAGAYIGIADLNPDAEELLSESNGSSDAYILKFDTDGNFIWVKYFGGETPEQLYDLIVDESDNIYTGGYYSATVDFDPSEEGEDIYTAGGNKDICVSKLDSDGNYLWTNVAGNTQEDRVYGLAIDSDGLLSVVGVFSGTVDFNPYDSEVDLTSAGYLDAFLWRLTPDCIPTSSSLETIACDSLVSPSENYVWTTSGTYMDTIHNFIGCDSVLTIELTVNNSFENEESVSFCTNYTWPINGSTYTEAGVYTASYTSELGCDSAYTLNLESTINTNITIIDFTIISDEDEGTYQWVTCPDFEIIDGATNQDFSPLENGEYAVILTKIGCMDTSNCITLMGLNLTENDLNARVNVYPNPTNGKFTIDLGQEYESITITITDLLGQPIMVEKHEHTRQIEISIQAPLGTYLMLIESDNKRSVVKKIVLDE